MGKLRIAIAQINLLVGDIEGNTLKVISYSQRARDELNAEIIVFPELTLTGYPPEDLLLRTDLYERVNLCLQKIYKEVYGIFIIIGYPGSDEDGHYNEAAIINNGKVVAKYRKQILPNYGVFDEKRYFQTGHAPCIFNINSVNIAVTICEDLWFAEPMAQAVQNHAQLMISINASPFDMYKPFVRENMIRKRALEGNVPIIYVNCVGGQDELVFDGGSMIFNAQGALTQYVGFFNEILTPVDLNLVPKPIPMVYKVLAVPNIEERSYKALVLGVRDYIEKNKFYGAIIGLSGGIDSALTLAIAVDAIGKNRVTTVSMPSRYTRSMSIEDARFQAQMLGVKHIVIPIESVFTACLDSLAEEFAGLPSDVTEENIQARCRGMLLMAISNKERLIVLSTGNKSEIAVGYATLYGDMAGGFCVLKDVLKTMVYKLVEYRNSISLVIPRRVVERLPSAELADNQLDQDLLPPYPILDAILERYVEKDQSLAQIVAAGFPFDVVKRVLNMIDRNEYKRRQAPPGVRITTRAFGRDRRYPITSGYSLCT